LVDIGANLTNKSFRADFDAVLERARDAGVGTILVTGTNLQASLEAREIASRKGAPVRLFSTAGIHPHHASTFGPLALDTLRETLAGDRVVAVGECGLDFNRNYSPRGAQLACFETQLRLAAELEKPVFFHERDAHEDFYSMVREHRKDLVGGVVHCFTGGRAALERYLALDLHIGITGWISDARRGRELFALVRDIPAERLMIETDAPYLLPAGATPKVPRRNEPSLLPHVLRAVARARGENDDDVARQTTETACRLFGL
jgi:TatD DNase family protein